ncbi:MULTISPECIES: HD family hydrolase [Terrabacteria group]|uniref:HD domain-containing protein n=1 Tax=Bacillati TaxID=1783272 RepID=UPI0019395C80|nr:MULTISPECIES: HD domain-containing protein [Terrabacteria group]MBW9212272.1 HD domain-containing protein [Trueperella sp. zg.1013]QRG86188.1 HD domain-containing protein [Bulleidia sp. zg-1006]
MTIEELMQAMDISIRLKDRTRHCYTQEGRHESVAEHCWMLTMMAFLLKEEYPDVDMNKVIEMCIIHDLGEIFTGDIPSFVKKEKDTTKEKELLLEWLDQLSLPTQERMKSLYIEMEEQKSMEAKIYKALDKMEAVFQHNRSNIQTWLPLEYDLQLTYGEKEASFSSYLKELREAIRQESLLKIEKET